MIKADELIERLGLLPHPEGGYYREVYRAGGIIPSEALPDHFAGERNFSTSIYFLLKQGEFSSLHSLSQDEVWHFYSGSALDIHVITPEGAYEVLKLGEDLDAGESFVHVVKGGSLFGASVCAGGEYALVGCSVAPGFDFSDFRMPGRAELIKLYPDLSDVITQLTGDDGD